MYSRFSLHSLFTCLFFGLALFLRFKVMNAPLDTDSYLIRIAPFLNLSAKEILFFTYNRFVPPVYKVAITNSLMHQFGVGETSYRTLTVIISLLTLFFIYRFVAKEIGRREALTAAFLFGISHYSLWTVLTPIYGDFYMFASFMTFYFLWKAFQSNHWNVWLGFGICNFFNLTSTIIAGNFIPPLMAISATLIFLQFKKEGVFSADLKKKLRYFALAFIASVAMAVIFYYARELNFLRVAYDMVFLHDASSADSYYKGDVYTQKSYFDLFSRLIYAVFVTFNFEFGDGGEIGGASQGYWSYFVFFIIGLWVFLKKDKKIFWCFMGIYLTPIMACVFLLKMGEARYLAFILPFYLITVATGFVHAIDCFLDRLKVANIPWRDSAVYISVFAVFSWLIQPGFLYSATVIDGQFHTEGIRAISRYLGNNIKPNDVVLNVTNEVELKSEYGDALVLFTHSRYLERFKGNNRLELLAHRTGKVGVWLILQKPLDREDIVPFYFPGAYSPRIVKKVAGMVLYYGEIEIPESDAIENDRVLTTPFWSFIKARELQLQHKDSLAEKYYLKFMEYGYNVEWALLNLGLIYYHVDPGKAFDCFAKAIQMLEAPTEVPAEVKLQSWDTPLKGKNKLPDSSLRSNEVRSYDVEKYGIKVKKYFKEDLILLSPNIYYKFYFISGTLVYNEYSVTGEPSLLEQAKSYLIRASQLSELKSQDLQPINLLSSYEKFPPLAVARNAP